MTGLIILAIILTPSAVILSNSINIRMKVSKLGLKYPSKRNNSITSNLLDIIASPFTGIVWLTSSRLRRTYLSLLVGSIAANNPDKKEEVLELSKWLVENYI